MKKTVILSVAVILLAIATIVLGVQLWKSGETIESQADTQDKVTDDGGNYTDEMKIGYDVDLSHEDGADSVERDGDHEGSAYFSNIDFYNLESSDTLTMLTGFKTYQQTSEWSCGVAAALMVLEYYGKLDDWNEESLAELRSDHSNTHPGTCLIQIQEILDSVDGFTYESTDDYSVEDYEIDLTLVRSYLEQGIPVMVGWNDWGGHWQVIIGYDDMGTETEADDVIIVADPYDTTDHNQDGYGVYGAERFYYNWTMYGFFGEEEKNDMVFIAAQPAA